MKENFTNLDELLAKKLAKETTIEEDQFIEDWLLQSPDNQRYFSDFQWLWLNVPHANSTAIQQVDTEIALQKVNAKLLKKAPQAKVLKMKFWMQLAAAVMVFALVAIYFFQNKITTEPLTIASQENIITNTLVDGTTFTLNNHSKMTVLFDFNQKERRVKLSGEAFFKVAANKEKPFVIEVQDLEVKVVGTAFNVEENDKIGYVKVTVEEGKVLLQSRVANEYLTIGETAEYEKSTGRITRTKVQKDANDMAYKNRIFVFDATPLDLVIKQLTQVYGTEIVLKNLELGKCPLSARYDNLTIERITDLIAETFSLKLERTGNKVFLDGKTCAE
jgi:transmembrane sensor